MRCVRVISVKCNDDEFQAELNSDDAIIGLGQTKEEAIANCVIANQGELDLEFHFVE